MGPTINYVITPEGGRGLQYDVVITIFFKLTHQTLSITANLREHFVKEEKLNSKVYKCNHKYSSPGPMQSGYSFENWYEYMEWGRAGAKFEK